ncbi:hypothetical protein ABZ646_41410 [Streptomyces sp. NPDC007162]|uniref:hypothetical protein n=1 Tax=Streptomyces sp. NPDC007162 TaxID=3156917 RepID=UPI00340FDC6E
MRLWGYGDGRLQPGAEFRTANGASDQLLDFDSTDDGTVLARLSRTLCLVRGTPTTQKRWHQLFPDLSYADPCR